MQIQKPRFLLSKFGLVMECGSDEPFNQARCLSIFYNRVQIDRIYFELLVKLVVCHVCLANSEGGVLFTFLGLSILPSFLLYVVVLISLLGLLYKQMTVAAPQVR